jgi:hypothetical protein
VGTPEDGALPGNSGFSRSVVTAPVAQTAPTSEQEASFRVPLLQLLIALLTVATLPCSRARNWMISLEPFAFED